MKEEKKRCSWTKGNPLNNHYHDTEWGVPVHDDRKLFEFLILDAFQAGLSWLTILKKRENFRKAFDDFDYVKISKYDKKKVDELMQNKGIIRNRRKIEAAISNAIAFMKIQKEYGSFDKYIWQFVDYETIINKNKTWEQTPTTSKESDLMSKDLRKRGFKFVGSTICYAFMQAAGMVNDHEITCFRYAEICKMLKK
jgi:DNA-3-methyladenine glycosylase I